MGGKPKWTPERINFVFGKKADGVSDKVALAEAHNRYFGKRAPNVVENGIKYCLSGHKDQVPWQDGNGSWENLPLVPYPEFVRRHKALKIAKHHQSMSSGSNEQMNSTILTPPRFQNASSSPATMGPSRASPSTQYRHSPSQSPPGQLFQPSGYQQNSPDQFSPSQSYTQTPRIHRRPSITAQTGYSSAENLYTGQMGPSNQHPMSPLGIQPQTPNQQPDFLGHFGQAVGEYGNSLATPFRYNPPPSDTLNGISPIQQQRYLQNLQNKSAQSMSQPPRTPPKQSLPPQQRYTQSASPRNTHRSPSVQRDHQSRTPFKTQNSPLNHVFSHDNFVTSQQPTLGPAPDISSMSAYPPMQSGLPQQRPRKISRLPPNQSATSMTNSALARNLLQHQGLPPNQFSPSTLGSTSVQNISSSQKSPVSSNALQIPTFLQGQECRVEEDAREVIYLTSPTFHGPVNIPPRAEGWDISFPGQDLNQSEPDCVIAGPRCIVNMYEPKFLGGINFMGDLPASAYDAVPKVPVVAPTSMQDNAAEEVVKSMPPDNRKRAAEEEIQGSQAKKQKPSEENIPRVVRTPTPAVPAPDHAPQLLTPSTPASVAGINPTASPSPPEQVTTPATTKPPPSPASTPSTVTPDNKAPAFNAGPTPSTPSPTYVAKPLTQYSDLDVPFGHTPNDSHSPEEKLSYWGDIQYPNLESPQTNSHDWYQEEELPALPTNYSLVFQSPEKLQQEEEEREREERERKKRCGFGAECKYGCSEHVKVEGGDDEAWALGI